jgi:hypothetical protein
VALPVTPALKSPLTLNFLLLTAGNWILSGVTRYSSLKKAHDPQFSIIDSGKLESVFFLHNVSAKFRENSSICSEVIEWMNMKQMF